MELLYHNLTLAMLIPSPSFLRKKIKIFASLKTGPGQKNSRIRVDFFYTCVQRKVAVDETDFGPSQLFQQTVRLELDLN